MIEGSKSKGKGKAKDDEGTSDNNARNGEQSAATRVITSASGLAQDIISTLNSTLPSAIASSSTLGSKSQSAGSSSGSSVWNEILPARRPHADNSQPRNVPGNGLPESFRTFQTAAPETDDLENFQKAENSLESGPHASENTTADAWVRQFQENHQTNVPVDARKDNPLELYTAAHIPELDDGAEVARLLSEPNFFAGTDAFEVTQMQEASEQDASDLFPQDYSPAEAQLANSIKATLPPAPVHRPMPADHPLNLRPGLLFDVEGLSASLADRDLVNSTQWLSAWDDVLNGYTDAVWGDLLPTVRAARAEIEEARAGKGALDDKAVSRLRMILEHVNWQ